MNICRLRIDALRIPFRVSFAHSKAGRAASDSVIVRLESDCGVAGYGEAVARPYVTGETVASCVAHLAEVLWPAARGARLPDPDVRGITLLAWAAAQLPAGASGKIRHNGARAAMESALVDLALRHTGRGLADILPPRRDTVRYSGVIGLGSVADAARAAQRYAEAGFHAVKCKVGGDDDMPRVAVIREVLGSGASLRLDANGAFNSRDAELRIERLARYGIAAVEQPLPRGNVAALARLQRSVDVPLMADESLVSVADARDLIEARACRYFNLRIAKLGGMAPTLAIAAAAREAGLRLQLGCQVGETCLLSALGRHVAAHLAHVEFVEGSFGRHLLAGDVAREQLEFGAGGVAPLLSGAGIGVEVNEDLVRKFSVGSLSMEVGHEKST